MEAFGSMGGNALGAAGSGMIARPPRSTVMGTQPAAAATNPMAGGSSPLSSPATQPMGGSTPNSSMNRGFTTFNDAQKQMLNDAGMGRSDWNSQSYQTDGGKTGHQLINEMYQIQDPAAQFRFYRQNAGMGAGGNDLQSQMLLDKGGLNQLSDWINTSEMYGGAGQGNYTGPAGVQSGNTGWTGGTGAGVPDSGGLGPGSLGPGPGGPGSGGPGGPGMAQPQNMGGPPGMVPPRPPRQPGGPGGPGMAQPQGSPGQPPGPGGFQGGTPYGGQGNLAQGGYDMGQGGNIQSGVQGGNYYNDQARQAYMDQSRRQLDPQWQQNQSNMESKLTNMGLARGSAAWEREAANMSRSQNDAYDMAGRNAILTGGQEGSRMQGMDIGAQNANNQAQQQGWNQRYGQAGLNLQGRGQEMDYGLRGRQMSNFEQLQDFNMMNQMRMQPYIEQNLAMQGMYPGGNPQFSPYSNYTPAGGNSQGYADMVQNANNQQSQGYSQMLGTAGQYFGGLMNRPAGGTF